MAILNPYLNFDGNAEEAFCFYRSVFGGEFTCVQRFKDIPEEIDLPVTDQDKIIHISLPIGNGDVIMATDMLASLGRSLRMGNNFYITINGESEEETRYIYKELSAGGKIEMPLQKAFWGALFGMFEDKFGIQWMVTYDYNEQSR
jgi:PhnB protein